MAGYSDTPLVKKLGLKSGQSVFLINPPKNYFDLVQPLPGGIRFKKRLTPQLDFIHLFATDAKSYVTQFKRSISALAKGGILWVSWPKKASGVITDLDETRVRETGLQQGLVDIKVCAIDDKWSGLKFVFRLKDR